MKRVLIVLMLLFASIMFNTSFGQNANVVVIYNDIGTVQDAPPPQLFVVIQGQRSLSDALSQSKCSFEYFPQSVSKRNVLADTIYNSFLSFAYIKGDDIAGNILENLNYFKSPTNYKHTNAKLYSWLNGIKLKC